MRRFAMLALSMSLLLGLAAAGRLLAQDEKAAEPKADSAPAAESKPEAKAEPSKAADEPPATIPPEVEAKLEAARRAVAEAIVAAEQAGLVRTSIDPPPVLDILITGRADDASELKKPVSERKGVNPEVFGAWFTGYGDTKAYPDIKPEADVRIVQPSNGLRSWYEQRASVLRPYLEKARGGQGGEAKAEPKAEETQDEARPADEKKDEARPADEKKGEATLKELEQAKPKEEARPKDEEKKKEAKPADEKEGSKPKDEEKKDESKPDEGEKKDESKSDDGKKDEGETGEPNG